MAELPQNWIESKLEYIVWHKKGSKPKKLYISIQEGFVPYIDIKAFEKNILEQYTEKNLAKLTKPNNILVVWDGARAGLVGLAPCIGAIGSTLVDIEPKTKEIINKYLYYFLFSNYAYINSKPRGTGTPHVNPDLYWNMLIPLPPSNEQKRIVEKLDKIELRYQKTKEYSDKLTQSILNKAFRGELVPQDPSDKPISLDEIQAQIVEKSSKKRKTLKNNKVQEMVKEIIEILKEYPEGISPEELFKNSKYSQKDFTDDDIIEFYKELSNLLDSKLTEEKNSVNHKILIKKVK